MPHVLDVLPQRRVVAGDGGAMLANTRAEDACVALHRGSLWFGDPYTCARGQAALIVGF